MIMDEARLGPERTELPQYAIDEPQPFAIWQTVQNGIVHPDIFRAALRAMTVQLQFGT